MADFELPGYEVFERIGRGGMATVYRALHLNLDREVAIKVMDPAMNKDESFSERFIREARISARLTHPHILQIYDVNTFNGLNYIAMELLAGGELADFIHGAMPQRQIYQILQQMTDALDYASGRGYVHRDIKPSNIMLRSEEDFVLADFGIARAANSGTQMTQTGLMVGTPSYMSPEQAKGQEVDGRSDLYALAVLAYEMLTKTLPYESDSAVTTAVKHLTEDIPTLPDHLSAYQDFINKGLAKSADDRFQTGRELYQAFMAASTGFTDDQVLTEAAEPVRRGASGVGGAGADSTSLAGVDVTRLSQSSSPAVSSSSRPYRLESNAQRERMVSGTYDNPAKRRTGSGVLGWIVALVVLAGVGYGGYTWWQGQQGSASRDLRNVTAELASAYSAMNDEDLTAAARAFTRVLEEDSGNAAARQGLEQLQQLYDERIQRLVRDGELNAAKELLMDIAAYFPGSLKLERYTEEVKLAEEQQRLARAQNERIARLTAVAKELAGEGDFDAARRELEQAVSLQASDPRVLEAQRVIDEAEAASAAYEQRWAAFSAEQRDAFRAAVLAADEALAGGDLEAASAAIATAAAIAPGVPELQSRTDRLQSARAQQAQADAEAAARLASLLDEADEAREGMRADPALAAEAADLYRRALEQSPGEARARQGLDQIGASFADIAQEAAGEGDFGGAVRAVEAGLALLPENAGLLEMQSSLPALQSAWETRLAEAEAKRKAEQAAQEAARATVNGGMRALQRGALADAQQAYDSVVAERPDLDTLDALRVGLIEGYAVAAREQITLKEFDAARDIIAAAAGHFPDEGKWPELETELETAKNSTRRRLGAY